MSAAKLLSEITTTNLLTVVNALRHDLAPPPDTGIPPLDDLLVSARKGMEGLLSENALQRGDMIEIQGASGSGKTTLLDTLLLTRILPSSFTFHPSSPSTHRTFPTLVHLGGSSLSCIVFSLSPSSPFSLLRLANTLRAYILTRFTSSAQDLWPNISYPTRAHDWIDSISPDIESLVSQSLARIRVWRGNGGVGSWELAGGLKRVQEVVKEEFGKEEELGLIAVDDFGEGFFQDGWEFLQREKAGKDQGALVDVTTQPMYHVLKTLTELRERLGTVVVLTTQALLVPSTSSSSSTSNTSTNTPFPKQHLAFPYVDPFANPPPRPPSSSSSSSSTTNNTLVASGHQPPAPPPPARPVPPEIRGLTHHITLLTPGERLKPIDLDKGLRGELREEERRVPRGKVRGILRVVGGVGAAREGRSWEIGIGREGLQVG